MTSNQSSVVGLQKIEIDIYVSLVRQLSDYIVIHLQFHVEGIFYHASIVFLRLQHLKGDSQASEI